jgi:hypothetical protein
VGRGREREEESEFTCRSFLFQIGETPQDQNAEELPFASRGEGERRNGITLLCKAAAG